MGWQWHQLDHMQIICILLQTINHASTSVFTSQMPFLPPTNSIKALKAQRQNEWQKLKRAVSHVPASQQIT